MKKKCLWFSLPSPKIQMCAHASIGIATHKDSQDNTHTHACERKTSPVCVSPLASKSTFSNWFSGFSFLKSHFFCSKPHLLMVLLEKQTDRQTDSLCLFPRPWHRRLNFPASIAGGGVWCAVSVSQWPPSLLDVFREEGNLFFFHVGTKFLCKS